MTKVPGPVGEFEVFPRWGSGGKDMLLRSVRINPGCVENLQHRYANTASLMDGQKILSLKQKLPSRGVRTAVEKQKVQVSKVQTSVSKSRFWIGGWRCETPADAARKR